MVLMDTTSTRLPTGALELALSVCRRQCPRLWLLVVVVERCVGLGGGWRSCSGARSLVDWTSVTVVVVV